MQRCGWVTDDEIYKKYHDEEWGKPLHDEHKLFEFLILEGAQAGLSWLTILKKRSRYQVVFDHFDPEKISKYDDAKVQEFLSDSGIVRNKLKINSAIRNAKIFLKIQKEFGSFDAYIWGFVNGKPLQNHWNSLSEIPAKTELSDKISKDLKKRGMNFVGSTIMYAFMQATGMVNDHHKGCYLLEK